MRIFALNFCYSLAILFLAIGCQEQNNQPLRAPIEGIKISDLAPPNAEQLPKQIQFDIVTFEMPAENYAEIETILVAFPDLGVVYSNRKMFLANGFSAAKGNQEMWPDLARALRKARARKALTSKLTIFDSLGDFININNINKPISAFYIDEDNHDTSIDLYPGTIALKIRTRIPQQFTGSAIFNITGMHKKRGNNTLPQLKKKTVSDETLFDYTNLRLELAVGDFFLLGCREYSHERLEVKNLFFNFTGDYPMPAENTEMSINNLNYEFVKDVPLVRLYMFACTRVDN